MPDPLTPEAVTERLDDALNNWCRCRGVEPHPEERHLVCYRTNGEICPIHGCPIIVDNATADAAPYCPECVMKWRPRHE